MPVNKIRRSVKVKKVPLQYKKLDNPKNFNHFPVLYLEKLENKENIHPRLRNKEYVQYVSKDIDTERGNRARTDRPSREGMSDQKRAEIKSSDDHDDQNEFITADGEIHLGNYREELQLGDKYNKWREDRELIEYKDFKNKKDVDEKEIISQRERSDNSSNDRRAKKSNEDRSEKEDWEKTKRRHRQKDTQLAPFVSERGKVKQKRRPSEESRSESDNSRNSESESDKDRSSESESDKDRSPGDESDIQSESGGESVKRKNSPVDSDAERESSDQRRPIERRDRHNRKPDQEEILEVYDNKDKDGDQEQRRENKETERTSNNKNDEKYPIPPPLSKLGKWRGDHEYSDKRDIEEDIKRREILFRIEILRKSYKNYPIPEFSEYTDVSVLEKFYEDTVKRVALDNNVENYKRYLTLGFVAVELVLGNVFSFDMKGFSKQQILSMNQYEKLLIELGEKQYLSGSSSWPVEIRLLCLILFNAAIFIISKMLFNSPNALLNVVSHVPTMSEGSENSSSSTQEKKKEKKMAGPNMKDLEELM